MKSNMKRLPSLFVRIPPSPRTPSVTSIPRHARRPDHSGGMKLNELHVDQLRAGVVGERMTVAGAIPTVARDLVRFADAAGGEDDRFRAKNFEPAAFAIVTKRADDSFAILQQREDANLHVHIDPLMNAVILQRANHFQAGAIAHVRQPRIFVAAEISLQNPAVFRAIENRAPCFEFAHAIGRFLRVQLRHAPIVDVLPAAHGVGEMHFPIIAIVDIRERGGDSAFGHHGVRFAEQTFANHPDRNAGRRSFDRRAQSGAAGADDENVVLECFVFGHADLENPQIVPDAHRAKAHVKIGETDPEQTHPGPEHVAAIETADAGDKRW